MGKRQIEASAFYLYDPEVLFHGKVANTRPGSIGFRSFYCCITVNSLLLVKLINL
jgi:hypothetical protein